MSRIIGIVIMLAGAALLYQVYDGWSLLSDRITKLLAGGGHMDNIMWTYVGGIACIVVGLFVANSSRPG